MINTKYNDDVIDKYYDLIADYANDNQDYIVPFGSNYGYRDSELFAEKLNKISGSGLKHKLNKTQDHPLIEIEKEYKKQMPIIGGGDVTHEEHPEELKRNDLYGGAKKRGSRHDVVRQVMVKHKLKLGQASKYVKEHNLW